MNYKNILMAVPVLLVSACNDSSKSESYTPAHLNIVKCNEPVYYIEKDSGLKMPYTIISEEKPKVEFSSDNSNVASVDNKGIVKALNVGQTNILVKAFFTDGIKEARCSVEVKPADITKIFYEDNSIRKIKTGSSINPVLTILPPSAADRLDNIITFSSSDVSKAQVDEYGKITGKSAGSAVIKASSKSGANASLNVEVSDNVVISTGLSFSPNSITMELGSTYTLKPFLKPDNVTNKNITYKSNKPDTVSVSQDGILKALSSGSAIIEAIMEDSGIRAEVQVSVNKGAVLDGINFPTRQLILYKGNDEVVELNVIPNNAEYDAITFASNNTNAVKVQKVKKNTVLLKAVEQGFKTDVTAVVDNCIYDQEDPRCSTDISIYTLTNNPTVPLEKLSVVFPYDYSDLRGTYSIPLKKGDVISPLSAVMFTPSNTTDRELNITIKNIDNNVLIKNKVDNNIIEAANYGRAKLIINSSDSSVKPVELNINVNATGIDYDFLPVSEVTSIHILEKKVLQNELSVKSLVPIEVKVSSKYKDFGYRIKDYKLESSNRDIIDIIDNKYVIAKAKGKAVITVTSSDVKAGKGKGAKDSVEIEVK